MTFDEFKMRHLKVPSMIYKKDLVKILGVDKANILYSKIVEDNKIYSYRNYIVDLYTANICYMIIGENVIDNYNYLGKYKSDKHQLVLNTDNNRINYQNITDMYSIDDVIIYFTYFTNSKKRLVKNYINNRIYSTLNNIK